MIFFVSFRKRAMRQKKMTELRIEFDITNNKHNGIAKKYVEGDSSSLSIPRTTVVGI
jgi:hypothetical protein